MILAPGVLTLAQGVREMSETFGGLAFKDQTTLHPLGLAMTVICGIALLNVRREWAVLPFIIMACFVSPAQRLVVANLDFRLIRILVLFGIARLILRSELRGIRWTALDFVVIAFAIAKTIIYTAQWKTFGAMIYQSGQIFDSVGVYFLMRCFIRTPRDLVRTGMGFAIIAVPVMLAFLVENLTGRNAFSIFGGVPAITHVREGRLRCQGAFPHPIIGGCFWASSLPLIAALWWQHGRARTIAAVGSVCALGIVGLSASSTPLMGAIAAMLGGVFYFVRHWTRWIFVGFCFMLVGLHFSMNKPVWHLISRITITRGNTGYHRYKLIDSAIHHFNEWCMLGTRSTAHWFWGGQDVTNQYVLEGVRGGFLTLVLFVATLALAYAAVGRTWRFEQRNRGMMIYAWGLGSALFVHCVNFIGVSYFGQIVFLWYLHLAMIGSFHECALAERDRRQWVVGQRTRSRRSRPEKTRTPGAPISVGWRTDTRG